MLAQHILSHKIDTKRGQPKKRDRSDLPRTVEDEEYIQRLQPIVIENDEEVVNEEVEQEQELETMISRSLVSSATSSLLSDPPESSGEDTEDEENLRKKSHKNHLKHTRFPDMKQDDGTTKYWTIGKA
jgi:hypothetical protein